MEASLKALTRWYMTPSRHSSIFPLVSPLYFQGCQMTGSMLHVWWDCTKIRSFCNKIFQIISKVTRFLIPKSPTTALLNFLIPKVPKYSQKLIYFILLGTKLSIAKAWKHPKVSIQAANRNISWIISQKKLMNTLLDTSKQF